jgi:predicted phosphoribosyltransferase
VEGSLLYTKGAFRNIVSPPPTHDDIATGATFYASLQLSAISTSAGLSPLSSPHDLGRKVDEVVILAMPSLFFGIDQFYLDWLKWRTKK